MANKAITKAEDLVTTHEQTRAGFISIALEKNHIGDPYVKNARAFKSMVAGTTKPEDFLTMPKIRPFLLSASGLSDKSLTYLDESDRTKAIEELINNFLKPSGSAYVDETIYRYLLTKGDAVGGSIRNRIGALGQEKLIRYILSYMNVCGIDYTYLKNEKPIIWRKPIAGSVDIEKNLKGLCWKNAKGDRVLGFNLGIPLVGKNVDICLFDGNTASYDRGRIVNNPNKVIMLGELKGGIDPAGADEHWKTANSALERIRASFSGQGYDISESFVGAAIENAMAKEIYDQLENDILANAANLNNDDQMTEYCSWLLDL